MRVTFCCCSFEIDFISCRYCYVLGCLVLCNIIPRLSFADLTRGRALVRTISSKRTTNKSLKFDKFMFSSTCSTLKRLQYCFALLCFAVACCCAETLGPTNGNAMLKLIPTKVRAFSSHTLAPFSHAMPRPQYQHSPSRTSSAPIALITRPP